MDDANTREKPRVKFTKEYHTRTRGSRYRSSISDAMRLELAQPRIRIIEDKVDVTPKRLWDASVIELFKGLVDRINQGIGEEQERAETFPSSEDLGSVSTRGLRKITLDDIILEINPNVLSVEDLPAKGKTSIRTEIADLPKLPTFIKVVLSETDDIVLFEKGSVTVPKDSEEAAKVIEDNDQYDFLTVGKGRNRRKIAAETQTVEILYKSRHANTDRIKRIEIGTFVSNYDMFDTYKDMVLGVADNVEIDLKKMEVSALFDGTTDPYAQLFTSSNFQLAVMLMQRMLAGNVFKEQQKRFRNMYLPDPLSLDVKYLYRMAELWTFHTPELAYTAVSSLCWCLHNSDILAVAYGIYAGIDNADRNTGYVCIWSIKNPVNPERKYRFNVPVTTVAFSKKTPQVLGIGLFDGRIEVLDITEDDHTIATIAVSERSTSRGSEPVTQIVWIDTSDTSGTEQLLVSSQDGTVMRYTIASGPFLIGFQQMHLTRVEGLLEGLPIIRKKAFIESDRHPQALMVTMHSENPHWYLVGTDEGCLHKCLMNNPHQHSRVIQVHDGSVFVMDFSPWSPKIFLTCGSDWCIRLWVEGVYEPIAQLSSGIAPVHSAYWSPINSTIILAATRCAVEIWDIRRSLLKPVSSQSFNSGDCYLTVAKFSTCGRSIIVGTENGIVHMCALEDMPFPPHFQYKELEAVIFKALVANPEVTRLVNEIGFLGYPDEKKKDEGHIKDID